MSEKYDVCVIGAGPGGYVAAIRAAQKGLKVAVVEASGLGGVCLNVGCIPSKALITASHHFYNAKNEFSQMGIKVGSLSLDMKELQAWKQKVCNRMSQGVGSLLKANKVKVISGYGKFVSSQELSVEGYGSVVAKNFIIASGSTPIELPFMKVDEKNILSSTGALALEKLPKKMAVVGGGYIGLELGTFFAKVGVQVTVIEASPALIGGMCDKDVTSVIEKRLKKIGVEVCLEGFAKEAQVKKGKVLLKYEQKGQMHELEVDKVLTTIGRKPNTSNLGLDKAGVVVDKQGFVQVDAQRRTNQPHIFAIGDVTTQPLLAHKASFEGCLVADILGGENRVYDVKCVPAVIFTDPEIASVGLTEKECKEQNLEVKVGKFPFAANGRAVSMMETEGFVKVIARRSDHVVVGLHIVGPEASQMISEGALALEMGARLEDLALTIHPHPTLGETVMEAAEVALGHPIHTLSR